MRFDTKRLKRLLLLNFPYIFVGLFATNIGEGWRLAEGANSSEKLLSFMTTLPAAFQNPLPSSRLAISCFSRQGMLMR